MPTNKIKKYPWFFDNVTPDSASLTLLIRQSHCHSHFHTVWSFVSFHTLLDNPEPPIFTFLMSFYCISITLQVHWWNYIIMCWVNATFMTGRLHTFDILMCMNFRNTSWKQHKWLTIVYWYLLKYHPNQTVIRSKMNILTMVKH